MEYEVISVFPVEGVELDLEEPEALQLVELLVRQERVRGEESEELQLVTVVSEELDSFYILPAVRHGEADETLQYSDVFFSETSVRILTWFPLRNLSRLL